MSKARNGQGHCVNISSTRDNVSKESLKAKQVVNANMSGSGMCATGNSFAEAGSPSRGVERRSSGVSTRPLNIQLEACSRFTQPFSDKSQGKNTATQGVNVHTADKSPVNAAQNMSKIIPVSSPPEVSAFEKKRTSDTGGNEIR